MKFRDKIYVIMYNVQIEKNSKILQSLALEFLKNLLSRNRSNFIDNGGNILWYYYATRKLPPPYNFAIDNRCQFFI